MGESGTWTVERLRPLVEEWDATVRAAMPSWARLRPHALARGSVLSPAASESEVAAAEGRLAVTFPPAYRSFLLIGDGADAGPHGAVQLWRDDDTPVGNRLLGAGELVTLADGLSWLLPIWEGVALDVDEQQAIPEFDEPVDVWDFGPGREAVLITEPAQDGVVALVPFPGEWQVWWFLHETVLAYQSFASFLHWSTRIEKARVAERRTRLRAGDYAHWSAHFDDLAADGDARAVDVAAAALSSEPAEAARRIGRIGDPSAIPMLRSAYQRGEPGALPILFALDCCGDPGAVDELRQLVQDGHADPETLTKYLDRRARLPRW